MQPVVSSCRAQRNTKLINLPSYLSALRLSKLLCTSLWDSSKFIHKRFVLMNIWIRSICTHFHHLPLPARCRHNLPTKNHIFSYSSAYFGSRYYPLKKQQCEGNNAATKLNAVRRIGNRDLINRNISVRKHAIHVCVIRNGFHRLRTPNALQSATLSFSRFLSTVRQW